MSGRSSHSFRHPSTRALALLLLIAGQVVAVAVAGTPAQAAGDPCGPGGNKISCENSKPGSPPSEWDDFYGAGGDSIQGFATDISVNVGQRIDFKVDTDASAYTIGIYRVGYYQGNGARKITSVTPSAALPQHQPQCVSDVTTELYDCGNWKVSASWNVPSTAVSGVYFALLHRADNGESSHITFVVRDDASTSDLVFQTADPTWQAYNDYGGSNFYHGAANGRAFKVSYNRPVLTRSGEGGRDFFFSNEYPLVRFLEQNGYDVSYLAGVDTDRYGQTLLTRHKTFLSVGHDEYWSGRQRTNVTAARDAGVNLMFLSGNEIYWRTRYEPSTASGTSTPYRTLVTYKETWNNDKIDPSPEWTGTWRDTRFAPTSQGGGLPENALTGTAFVANHDDLAMQVSAAEGRRRLWRNTSLATMASGTTATLAPHTVGYESDEDVDNGFRPGGLIHLSTTVGDTPQYVTEYGNKVEPGTTRHHLTMYRASSGALVFGAGTIQWTWGLDGEHDSMYAPEPADPRMRQAQVNLLADMSAQPTTLAQGLVASSKSTDATGPVVTVTAPSAGASRANGSRVTVTGTATDSGGGVVAGVEVSTDGGATWRMADGTTSWSFDYVQHGVGPTPFKVRAMDDSANIGQVVSRDVAVSCPCSVFGATAPDKADAGDGSAVELGLRFVPTQDGFVSGVRFFKSAANLGTHVGSLWGADGQLLGRVTFAGETATGWQSATFDAPLPVTAGQAYVVSYRAPQGHYPAQKYGFTDAPLTAVPLRVPGGFGAEPSGVYGNPGQFPAATFANTNYYVDVTWVGPETAPLTASERSPLPGSTSVPTTAVVSAKYSKAPVAGSVYAKVVAADGSSVAGSTSYDSQTKVVTFTPSEPLAAAVTFSVTLQGVDQYGNQLSTGRTWSFTTARPPSLPGACPCGIFDDGTQPGQLDSGDKAPVTLGMRFSSTRSGSVTGLRFYKGPDNTGTHVGSLWSASGALLASGTFAGESTAGWQTLVFDTPVDISAGTDYLVSYRSPTGAYSLTSNAFSAANLSRGPLVVDNRAGAFTYGTGWPSSTSSTSYLVDVVFVKGPPSISLAGQDPPAGSLDVPRGTTVRAMTSEPIKPGWSLSVSAAGSAVAGTARLDASATTITFTSGAPLPADAVVTMTLTGVVSTEGAILPTQTWTFTTTSPQRDTGQTLFSDQVPAVPDTEDSSPIELGTAFAPAEDGVVTGVRFFKGAGNTGRHTGSLWTASGTRLATVTFVGESDLGWQTAVFSTPVQIQKGTDYVVSYYAPRGHYASTQGFFSGGLVNGDLSAPGEGNGRFRYGTDGGFPTSSYSRTSYFVDVLYSPSLKVTSRSPDPGATAVSVDSKPRITFSVPVQSSATMTLRRGTQALAGTVATSNGGRTLTFTPSAALPTGADLTVTVSGIRTAEGQTLADQSWSFTTEAQAMTTTSLFADAVPATAATADGSAIELGTAITTSVAGTITAIRFYKGPGNNGTHTGSIWSATGTRLATVTFTDETASGWQQATLATPLAVAAGDTFVVSYYAPVGWYAASPGFFADPWVRGPLTAGTSNGRYLYGSGGGFPTGSWGQTNYFVDVVFRHQGS